MTLECNAFWECQLLFVNVPAWHREYRGSLDHPVLHWNHWTHSVTWGCSLFNFFFFVTRPLVQNSPSRSQNVLSFHPLSVSLEWNYDVVLCDNPPVSLPRYTWHTWAKSKSLGSGERPRFLPANGDRQVHRDQNIPANVFVFIPQRARGQQNVCSVLFCSFSEWQLYMNSIGGVFFKLYLNWLMITSVIWNYLIQ